MKEVKSLSELKHGDRVTCKINGVDIKDARVSVAQGGIYICQNSQDGNKPSDMLGYKFGWQIGWRGANDEWEGEVGVTDIYILDDEPAAVPLPSGDAPTAMPTATDAKREFLRAVVIARAADLNHAANLTKVVAAAVEAWDAIEAACGGEVKP